MFATTVKFPEGTSRENTVSLHDVEAKPRAESLQAVQEAEDFFVSGQKARFEKPEEVFDELGI